MLTSRTADGKCQIVIDVEDLTVPAEWRNVWLAMEAIVAMCTRAGKGGKWEVACEFDRAIRLPQVTDTDTVQVTPSAPGQLPGLFVSVMDEVTPTGVVAISQDNSQSATPSDFAGSENPESLPQSLASNRAPTLVLSPSATVVIAWIYHMVKSKQFCDGNLSLLVLQMNSTRNEVLVATSGEPSGP